MVDMHSTAHPRSNAARICTILGFVSAVLAVFLLPPVFGLIGIALGVFAAVRGDKPLGWYAAAASAVGAVLGFVLSLSVALLNS